MRWLLAIVGCSLAAPLAQAQDAQKLFEAMEQKIAMAKAQKFDFESETMEGPRSVKIKGTVILATGSRVKATVEVTEGKKSKKGTMVSDGTTVDIRGEFDDKADKKTTPAHEKLYEILSGWLARAGYMVATNLALEPKPHELSQSKLSGFKTIGKEKVGGRDAVVIEYQITFAAFKESATCRLWLDAKNNLPLKRSMEYKESKLGGVETYSNWQLDPQLPEGTFTLPK